VLRKIYKLNHLPDIRWRLLQHGLLKKFQTAGFIKR